MTFDLGKFALADMLKCGNGIRRSPGDANSVEDIARSIVNYLYGECTSSDDSGAGQTCALVRFYLTIPYHRLETHLQTFADAQVKEARATPNMKCLTLLASMGQRREWCDRRQSKAHRAIPLPSAKIVERAPMISQLMIQMGLDISAVLSAEGSIVPEHVGKTYNVFHVAEAQGSPYIPAQKEFVEAFGVRSVLGFGGVLHTGDLFATIMFARGPIPADAALRFRNIALDVKATVHPFADGKLFARTSAQL